MAKPSNHLDTKKQQALAQRVQFFKRPTAKTGPGGNFLWGVKGGYSFEKEYPLYSHPLHGGGFILCTSAENLISLPEPSA